MSLVYITHHDERIFDVEPELEEVAGLGTGGRTAHISHHSSAAAFANKLRKRLKMEFKKHQIIVQPDGVRLLTTAKKSEHRTMGCANTPIDPPCAYLRKNQGIKWRRENDHVCVKGADMPPLPKAAPKKCKESMSPNFVARNINCAITSKSCCPPPRYVDTPFGTRHNLVNSGLLPQFICSKNFGKVPLYLKKNNKMLKGVREMCAKEQARLEELCSGGKIKKALEPGKLDTDLTAAGVRIMEQAERSEILEGLKQHLSEMTKAYQSMPLLLDSVAKRQRKGKLESDLRLVEQDIQLIETSPIIYVSLY